MTTTRRGCWKMPPHITGELFRGGWQHFIIYAPVAVVVAVDFGEFVLHSAVWVVAGAVWGE